MATIKYFTRKKSGLATIYLRLRDGRKTDLTTSTGYAIKTEFWSNIKGEPKQIAANKDKLNLTNSLRALKNHLFDALNKDKGMQVINLEWLLEQIETFKNPQKTQTEVFLIDAIKSYQSDLMTKTNARTGKPISSTTIKSFNTLIKRITKFESFKKHKYLLHEVDLTFHSEYIKFASTKAKLSTNSVGKDLRQVKTVCLDARDRGQNINRQLESRKFNAPTEPTDFVTLNETEIHTIKNHEFSQDYLSNARDWLIIGVWTGCRVNDLMQLSEKNIIHNNKGQKFIRYTQSKTGKQVDLPIHPQVNEILQRLGGFPRLISAVKFNLYIKKVCKDAGITEMIKGTKQNPQTHLKETGLFEKWQLVKSHTCRRSFATNHYNKLSNKLIMRITGHTTEKMLLQYIGETENDHLDDFMNVWSEDTTSQERRIKTA